MAEWKGSALLRRRAGRSVSQVRILLPLLFRRSRVGKTRDCYSRGAGSIPAAGASHFKPPWSKGMTPGSQPGSCGFESRRGFFQLVVGEPGTPPVSGTGDRRFESCRPDTEGLTRHGCAAEPRCSLRYRVLTRPGNAITGAPCVRGLATSIAPRRRAMSRQSLQRSRGGAVLASLMSLRSWVRIPPAQLGGVAQREEHSLVRRKGAGSNPVAPVLRGGCGVTAAPGVVIPAASVRIRSATLLRGR